MVIPASGSSAHAASFVARAAATAFAFVLFASVGGCTDEEDEPAGKFSGYLIRATTPGCIAADTAHPAASVEVASAGSGKLTITFRAGSETCVLAGDVTDDGVATVTSTKSCAIFPASTEGASAGTYSWTVPTPNITR